MSDKTRRRGTKTMKQQATSADRQARKRGTRRALAETCADERDVFVEVDAALKRALAKASTVVEVNSRLALGDDVLADELKAFHESMWREAQMVPGTLFHWPAQKQYMMAFEVDGQMWVYRAEDLADWGPENLAMASVLNSCGPLLQEDLL